MNSPTDARAIVIATEPMYNKGFLPILSTNRIANKVKIKFTTPRILVSKSETSVELPKLLKISGA